MDPPRHTHTLNHSQSAFPDTHLLHQVHDPLKGALFIPRLFILLFKVLTDLSHDFGLLFIALVVV